MLLKKLLSILLSLFVLAGICLVCYFNRTFVNKQVNKVKSFYCVYKGDLAYRELDMPKAIGFYNKGVSLYPKHYGAWYNLGNIYVAYEDYNSALFAYSQAFKYNPKLMIARMNYGIIASEKMGDFDSAIEQYKKITEINRRLVNIPYIYDNKASSRDNKAIAYYNMGVTYKLKSLYSEDDYILQRQYLANALKSYQKSVEINPDSYDTQYNLGVIYHTTGDYDNAGKCYCKAIKLEPMNYEAHYNLAILLRKLRYYKESYDEMEKASALIAANSDNSDFRQYVSIVMSDITRNVYFNKEYRDYLNYVAAKEEYLAKHSPKRFMFKKDKNKKKNKDDKSGETISPKGIKFVKGKIKVTNDADKIILKNFGECPSIKYFDPNY